MQIIRTGSIVRVRQQRWRIADVRGYARCQVVNLAGVGSSNLGKELQVIVPFDQIDQLDSPVRLRVVQPARWRTLCRGLLAHSAPFDGLRTAAAARIELLPYQLEPALALVRGAATRILIADEVGLGKTIQAALAIAELRARGAADRILILTPAGLREQWRGELADRFLLDASIVDTREAKLLAARAPLGTNPWTMAPIAIASMDFVKRPEVLPSVSACRWDVVVIDEAHGSMPGSDRYHAASVLGRKAAYVLLLSATPHSGDEAAFESLCNLGVAEGDRLLIFHRTRSETHIGSRRRIHRLGVRASSAEQLMHRRLSALTDAFGNESASGVDAQLPLAVLKKRASSSPWSLLRSIERRIAILETPAEGHEQASLPFDDGNGELDSSDDAPVWTGKGLNDVGKERTLLAAVAAAARTAVRHDSKLLVLVRLLRRLAKLNEQAIVFTEYRDTLMHLSERLGGPAALLHGGLSRDERRAALDDFAAGRRSVLLATDAAGEGLNLHHRCRVVINLELPWNPVRLEQRAGRVDRIGQTRTVHAFHLIATPGAEMIVLERLRARIDRARTIIGAADPLTTALAPAPEPITVSVASPEHTRLLRQRQLLGDSERSLLADSSRSLLADSPQLPALSFARSAATRTQLDGRVLVVMQARMTEDIGHIISSNVSGFLVRCERLTSRSQALHRWRELWTAIEQTLQPIASNAIDENASTLHRAFWTTRLERERRIAAVPAPTASFQAGLFDARAERRFREIKELQRTSLDEADRRLHELTARMNTTMMRTRLVLVLLP